MCHRTKCQQNWPNGFADIAIFGFKRWLPFEILDFKILKFLVALQLGRANMHRHAKFRQNPSNGC